ncbi:MAG: twin-arginine translocase TatA/TatE family subunit [Pirellulales bacterium]|nr:twin-arginine translocase TatA/TatE family subunit [Pirellulales bacterium]
MISLFAFLGSIGLPELLVLGFVILLLFGNRLPGVMRSLGQGVVEFKKGVQGIDDDEEQARLEKSGKKNISENDASVAAKG